MPTSSVVGGPTSGVALPGPAAVRVHAAPGHVVAGVRFPGLTSPGRHLREYRFQATNDTMEALRMLRGAWRGMAVAEHEITIILRDGKAVRVGLEAAEVEDRFEAFRITARVEPNAGVYGVPVEDFIDGNNDIVLFTGVTWSEPHGELKAEGVGADSSMHFSGHPGQLSESAEVVCVTTDAFVVASSAGRGILIRTALRPGALEVERSPEKVRAFLLERGYEG